MTIIIVDKYVKKSSTVDFWQCEFHEKEWLVPREIGTTKKGVCLSAAKTCQIVDKKKAEECKKIITDKRLKFIKSKGEFILDKYNNKQALNFELNGIQRGIVVW